MDIASQQPNATPVLDPTVGAPALTSSRLRHALLTGTVLATIAGLVGAFLCVRATWATVDSDSSKGRGLLGLVPGTLQIDSEPSEATVMLDGQDVGMTPLTLSGILPGPHRVVISASDYEDWAMEVRIPSAGTASHTIALVPLPARLAISTSAPGARVAVDGQLRASIDRDIVVAPGQRVVRVEAKGYRSWQRSIELAPNEHRSLEVELGTSWLDAARDGTVSPLAIIVENEAHARPQAGLDRADIVYEALAEGGITRFLAIYASQTAEVVGPVRSARDYFVEWAREYTAPLVHIGASPQGYAAIAATHTFDLDEIRGHPGFWRSADRSAPHNAYTSTDGARSALGSRAFTKGTYSGLRFSDRPPDRTGTPASEATVRFGSWKYTAGWTYDPVTNEYLRDMDDEPHVDAETGEQLRATNVLLQWVDSWLIPGDREGRLEFASIGSGRLVALIDGVAIEGQWRKDSAEAPTQYLGADGAPLWLYPGATWIEIIPPGGSVTF